MNLLLTCDSRSSISSPVLIQLYLKFAYGAYLLTRTFVPFFKLINFWSCRTAKNFIAAATMLWCWNVSNYKFAMFLIFCAQGRRSKIRWLNHQSFWLRFKLDFLEKTPIKPKKTNETHRVGVFKTWVSSTLMWCGMIWC